MIKNDNLNKFNAERWFWLFLSIHVLAWTLAPALIRRNLPLDAIEGTLWGQQWQLGYDKNPFLNGWLTTIAGSLSHPSGWMIYFFSQISVGLCFWAVWRLGKAMMPAAYALVGVALLEALQYYNFHSIDFNDNTLELSTWGLATYAFYLALQSGRLKHWVMWGVFAALGMMAKYYTLVLLASMGLFMLFHPAHRRQLSTLAPYAGVLVFIALCLPHVWWLFHHNFITVRYVFERADAPPDWSNHFVFPLKFIWQQFEVFLPALLVYGLLFLGGKPRTQALSIKPDDRLFLACVGLGPTLLTAFLSLVCGTMLRAGWGMPLQSLWPLVLLSVLAPRLSRVKCLSFMAGIFLLIGAAVVFYRDSLVHSPDASSGNFPGLTMATVLTEEWHIAFHRPLVYVAGSRWIGGNIEYYSSDHPAVFMEWDLERSPWIHLPDLNKKGAIFVWDVTDGETLPPAVRKAYPRLRPSFVLEFKLKRNEYHLPPQKVGVAILPPE